MALLDLRPLTLVRVAATLVRVAALEAASYPADEAASPETLRARMTDAGDYFRVVYCGGTLAGFICGTRCAAYTQEAMGHHDAAGRVLAVHSVVVDPTFRRRGVATAALRRYVAEVCGRGDGVEKVMLIAKANLLKLYLAAGFSVDGPSAVVHGSEPWLQCSLDCKWATDIVVVDSFTEMAFSGNPAAVVFLEDVPHDEIALEKWMQNVALENNLSETAFVTCQGGAQANIRYFSPTCEVDLCGHATLAAAHALFSSRRVAGPRVDFATKRAGAVAAELRADGLIELDFPLDENPPRINDPTLAAALAAALKLASAPANVHRTAMNDVQCEIEKAEVILGLEPDMALLAAIDCRLVVPYAAGARAAGEADYTYRCFGPRVGIPEDPVTGSAQCALAPLFKSRYGKDEVIGHQASKRGGVVRCRVEAGRVRIAGGAVETLRGKIPPPQTPARD